MHRVELKGFQSRDTVLAHSDAFLMHRVELKDNNLECVY